MRSTILHEPGRVVLEERPEPTLRTTTGAIVRTVASCICGSDLWPYRGADEVGEPRPIGHEVVGVVEEVGDEVTAVAPGDFVVVPFDHCDGTCPHCLAGMPSGCDNLGITKGGQSELVRVDQAQGSLVATPGHPDDELVPHLLALADVMATGWHAAVSAGVAPGATVVVVGDGAVGLCGVLAARELGAERIIAMSRYEDRRALATRFGATDLVAERGEEGEQVVAELTGGIGADAVLECVGTNQAMRTALTVARPGATVGWVGVPHDIEPPFDLMFRDNKGLAGGMAPVRRYLPDLVRRVLDGAIEPGAVFDRHLPLADVAEGYRLMDEREAIKVLLRP